MKHLKEAAEQGHVPAKESLDAINRGLNAQIIFGICDLFYYASNIIDESNEKMDARYFAPVIDKKQRREMRAKKHAQGLVMGGM